MELKKITIAGKEIYPIIEGGKGISVSDGVTAGNFALNECAGTFSGTIADSYDENGNIINRVFHDKNRKSRHLELIEYAVAGGIAQAKRAYEISNNKGLIFMNMLWEMGSTPKIMDRILKKTKGMIHAVSCGAGIPFKLPEITTKYGVYFNPIISSIRMLKLLWKKSYSMYKKYLGAVIYEDPWIAGGHLGMTNKDDPNNPEKPYERVKEIRAFMNKEGLNDVPIIIAGGIWWLSEWQDYIDNPEIGPVGFQFGTRPIITQESPVSMEFKKQLMNVVKDDVKIQRFSPTGFYSSAVKNDFLMDLYQRSDQAFEYKKEKEENFTYEINYNGKNYYINPQLADKYEKLMHNENNVISFLPAEEFLIIDKDKLKSLQKDQADCVGCLSNCVFSGWSSNGDDKKGDIRSYCIYKTLSNIAHSSDIENNLLFAGKNAYRFKEDPFYKNGTNIPTIKELIEQIKTGY
jgi:NAD(P)H-dependent flavin oxidoreductase YrpB (nitropropane dioxygenase family)